MRKLWCGALLALLPGLVVAEETLPVIPGISLEGIVETDDVTGNTPLDAGALDFQEQDSPELVSPDAVSYQLYITDLESRHGAYASGLSEQLLGLGAAYQEQGLYKEAIKVFKRAVHLTRINNGLYAEQQIPILQRLISSYISAGEYSEADERQYYLYRVQRRVYQRNTGALSRAMLERADWERQAYYLSVGETSFTRLLAMWELYRSVLRNIAETEGQYSSKLEKPLKGLLQTQYLIAEYEGESSSGFEVNTGGGDTSSLAENRFTMLRNSNYSQGTAAFTALRDVYVYNDGEGSSKAALSTLELADWQLWYKKRKVAWDTYRSAWGELAALENGEALLAEQFGSPVMLPRSKAAHADLEPRGPVSGYATVSYEVNGQGRVTGLDLLQTQMVSEDVEKAPIRLLRRLKSKRFRPRFENGEPVATKEIVEQYAY